MKVLLTAVNAKYIHSNLAVYDLRAYAEAYGTGGAQVEIAEYTINHTIDYILEGIYKAKPDVLCFSCYIWNLDYVEQLMDEYHKICPEVPIWVGGPEVSYETEAFLKEHPQVTGVMIGEGEETFLELCESYAKAGTGEMAEKKNLSGSKGIMYRAGESLVKTGAREPLDLNRIPFCYGGVEDFRNRIIYYESSRGCPFRCSYCLSSVEKTLRFRDVERVKKELAFFLEQEVAQVKFVDRTFNCRHEHAMEIWKFLIEHDNGVTNFHFEISADLLTDEEIALIGQMRPGLIQLEIGVQSTNDATITEIHRTMQLDRLKAVVRSIQEKENIHEHLDLIAGLPYEGYETFARSFDEIYALKPNQLQLGFLKVLKGSYMYEHAAEYGLIYRSRPPYEVLKTKWLGFGEILRIRQVEEMLEVYYNSGQYATAIRLLETQYASAFAMFAELGTFYEEHGYFGMGHSRMRRAEILLEFAKERKPGLLPVLGEGLVYDLYERENLGSRPAWAADANEWKQMTRQYGKNGKQSHIERFFYRFSGHRQDTASLPERLEDPVYVRFDYTGRDPLDHQARHEYLEPSGE